MLKALVILENGNHQTIPNSDADATYNTIPSFK